MLTVIKKENHKESGVSLLLSKRKNGRKEEEKEKRKEERKKEEKERKKEGRKEEETKKECLLQWLWKVFHTAN